MTLLPEDQNSKDRLAAAAESFEEQLREHGQAEWPQGIGGDRIPSVIELINATLRPGSTYTDGSAAGVTQSFVVPRQVGRFKVGPEVGRGGFGVVYRARDELLHRDVALKAIPRTLDHEASSDDMRLREARAVARLNHPNLVPLYEVLDDEHCVYLISEFCEGPTLAAYLRELGGPMDPKLAAEITLRIAQAVAHAHDRGLVHRDIKPSNVLLMSERIDADALPFTPRLTDFGLVLETTSPNASASQSRLVGTVNFMSPEQILGDDRWDARFSDIYSLGLLLFRMLAGRLPYQATTLLELVEELNTQACAKLPERSPKIPVDLTAICYRAIQKSPSDRYATARELAEDLQRFRDGYPVLARQQTLPERFIRAVHREPIISSLVAALILLIVVSAVTLASSNHRLREQGKELEQAFRLASANESKAIQTAYHSDLTQAFSFLAKQDAASALTVIERIEGYLSGEHRDRFDFKLLQSLANRGWSQVIKARSPIEEITFDPVRRLFVVASEADGIFFVRESDGRVISRCRSGAEEKLKALAVSPDGKHLAIAKSFQRTFPFIGSIGDQTVSLLPLAELVRECPTDSPHLLAAFTAIREWGGFPSTVESLAFSPDSQLLATGSRYEPLRVFAVDSESVRHELASERRNEDLSFASNRELTWMAREREIVVHDLESDQPIKRLSLSKPHALRRVRCSPDGEWIVTALHDLSETYLYATDRDVKAPIILEDLGGAAMALDFSPDSRFVAVGSMGGHITTWDLQVINGQLADVATKGQAEDATSSLRVPPQRSKNIHQASVAAVAISDTGNLLSGSSDGVVAFTSGSDPEVMSDLSSLRPGTYTSCVSKEGDTFYFGCVDGSIWSKHVTDPVMKCLRDPGPVVVEYLTISPDDRWLVAGFRDGHVSIRSTAHDRWHDVPYRAPSNSTHVAVGGVVFNVAVDGMLIVRGTSQLQWIDIQASATDQAGLELSERYFFHAPTSTPAVALYADDTVRSFGDTCYIIDPASGGRATSRSGMRDISCCCVDQLSETVFIGTLDGRVVRIDRADETRLDSQRWRPLESRTEVSREITSIILSPDGKNVLTGSNLGEIGIWDAATLRYLGTIVASDRPGPVNMLRVVKEGSKLVAYQRADEFQSPSDPGVVHVVSIR